MTNKIKSETLHQVEQHHMIGQLFYDIHTIIMFDNISCDTDEMLEYIIKDTNRYRVDAINFDFNELKKVCDEILGTLLVIPVDEHLKDNIIKSIDKINW